MFISEWSILSQKPPTKGHAAPPHDHEQPLGTHTHLPDEAHLRVHDIVYQVLEKISAPNFCESQVHLWGNSRSNWIRAWSLVTKREIGEKLRKVTAHCSVILKDENEKQPANLGGNRLENTELEKKQKILKYLFYRWKTKPRVNDLSCNLLLVNLRNVLQRMYYS